MTDSSRAILLSYASQDAEAARRIRDALSAAGLDVWFDQSGLCGGDAWDAAIRRQIRECALFVPIISANMQSRTEGYFRLEWRLAEQRSHLMARGRPFLVPVVVDGTAEAGAHVPDVFLEVQWTRLPAGQCDATFAARVRQLQSDGIAAPRRVLRPRRPSPRRPRPGSPRGERGSSRSCCWSRWGRRSSSGFAIRRPLRLPPRRSRLRTSPQSA